MYKLESLSATVRFYELSIEGQVDSTIHLVSSVRLMFIIFIVILGDVNFTFM